MIAPDEEAPWWMYRARPDPNSRHEAGVVDGDTFDVVLDQGLSIHQRTRLRLSGIDTAETWGVRKDSHEFRMGKEQTRWVLGWMIEATDDWSGDWPLVILTERDEAGSFGRYLAQVYRRSDSAILNDALIEEYPGVEVP